MENIILIVTAICQTDSCLEKNVAYSYEQESEMDVTASCGQCQNVINDLTATPKV
jgi:hypothetical protein